MKNYLAIIVFSLFSSSAIAEPATVTFHINKVTCVTCPVVIVGTLEAQNGVDKVITNLDNRTAIVSFDDELITIEAMQKATAEAGYPASVQKPESK